MEALVVVYMTAHLAVMGWVLLTIIRIQRCVDLLTSERKDIPRIKKDIIVIQDHLKHRGAI